MIRNESENVITNPIDIKKYYEQLSFMLINFVTLIDKFPEMYKLPKPTQGQTENLYSPTAIKEIEFIIKKSFHKKLCIPTVSLGECYQT